VYIRADVVEGHVHRVICGTRDDQRNVHPPAGPRGRDVQRIVRRRSDGGTFRIVPNVGDRNRESGIGNRGLRTGNWELGTGNWEPRRQSAAPPSSGIRQAGNSSS
jgi:hypothetical protein